MSSTLAFSEINTSEEANSVESQFKKLPSKDVKKPPPMKLSSELLKTEPLDETNDIMSDFNPLGKPESASMLYKDSNSENLSAVNIEPLQDSPVSKSTYDKININQSDNYYQQYLPPYNSSNAPDNNDLSKKINYMIHILEEQQDIKHGSVTEELVLYCFLGVFIIYVVDSFVKVGKYVR
jgi:hypothetical protein